jgi:hypothetical protein
MRVSHDRYCRTLINRGWTSADTIVESINPATGEVLGQWYEGAEPEARRDGRRTTSV